MAKIEEERKLVVRVVKEGILDQFLSLYMGVKEKGITYKAEPIVFTKIDQTSFVPAAAPITPTEAQALMDSLWECGIRPTEGTGSAGAMAAVQRHLEDMRTLVFK